MNLSATPIPKSKTVLSGVVKHKLVVFVQHLPRRPHRHRTRSRQNSRRTHQPTVILRRHRYRVARRSKVSASRVRHRPRAPCRRRPPRPHHISTAVRMEATLPIPHRPQRHQTCIRCARQRRHRSRTIANDLIPDKNQLSDSSPRRCKACSITTRMGRRRTRRVLRIKSTSQSWWAYGRRRRH